MATATEVAQWMIDHIRAQSLEYHDVMLQEIAERFGDEWVPPNDNGNPAISPKVLRQFRKLHGGTIEWSRGEWSVVGN